MQSVRFMEHKILYIVDRAREAEPKVSLWAVSVSIWVHLVGFSQIKPEPFRLVGGGLLVTVVGSPLRSVASFLRYSRVNLSLSG